jgi:hypothetical protein
MAIKMIPLSRLAADLAQTLSDCAESGETLVVELPDERFLAIQSLDPQDDDSLIDELLATNTRFRDLIEKSHASPRKAFVTGEAG